VRRSVLPRGSKLLKRIKQLSYLASHPVAHGRCAAAVARSPLRGAGRFPTLKYVGDHLALSLRTNQRREALIRHHAIAADALSAAAARQVKHGAVLWRREINDRPPLLLTMQPAKLAPMEGELELSFVFRTRLYVLTFLFAPGHVFSSPGKRVLFIGGLQGRYGSRDEIREASRLNHEIAPITMLLLAIRAIARAIGADELLAISETDQISMSYAAPMVQFDYGAFWSEFGGKRRGNFYVLPIEVLPKPLRDVSPSHRSRARRRREEKQGVTDYIERTVRELLGVSKDRRAQREVS
jgi:uncharacterized protein VirK/YbjX